jgi:hypothetical protein
MALAAITADLLDTSPTRLHEWARGRSRDVEQIGLTRTTCIPVGHSRQRYLSRAAIWRIHAHAIQPLNLVYAVSTWPDDGVPQSRLRVLHVATRLGELLTTWPLLDDVNWNDYRLTHKEKSDLIIRASH